MPRDHRVTAHVSEQTRKELDVRADQEDMSLSAYTNMLIERGLRQEAENEVAAQSRAVENLQKKVDEGTRQLRDVADDIDDKNAKMGAYAVAAFEIVQRGCPESVVNEALQRGSEVVHGDEIESPEAHLDGNDAETNGGEPDYDPHDPFGGDE